MPRNKNKEATAYDRIPANPKEGCHMTPTSRITETDSETIRSRNRVAQSIIEGFAAELPALDYFWRFVITALADVPPLLAGLAQARLRLANLAAAATAAIAAERDGEPDPLFYLRDELDAQGRRVSDGNGETR